MEMNLAENDIAILKLKSPEQLQCKEINQYENKNKLLMLKMDGSS